jgi:hypothetical protein
LLENADSALMNSCPMVFHKSIRCNRKWGSRMNLSDEFIAVGRPGLGSAQVKISSAPAHCCKSVWREPEHKEDAGGHGFPPAKC